ncbi:hypothetical protein ACFV9D_25100 [Streptomyces sp. NPDC059875]|uniref:hypothetical protein n=1 Tax=unclassified Streptomyces TaxID=2593676 RepID=UPI0036672C45
MGSHIAAYDCIDCIGPAAQDSAGGRRDLAVRVLTSVMVALGLEPSTFVTWVMAHWWPSPGARGRHEG